MGRYSGAASVALSGLARLNVSPDRRAPNQVAVLGDSRVAAVFADQSLKRMFGALSAFNWANALLGQRMTVAAALGVSGDRTDQMAARAGAAIASGAGLLYMLGGLNDIAQNFPAAATSGATAAANLIGIANRARAAGMAVVIEVEVGAGNLSTAQVVQTQELNARLGAFARATSGVFLHDARGAVLDPTTAEGALGYRSGFNYDPAHPNARGAQAWGRSLAALLGAIVPPRSLPFAATRADAVANGRWQLVRNPIFLDGTGGIVGTGASAPVPIGWEARANSGTTLTISTASHPQAPGNRATAAIAFGAAGHNASLIADIGMANVQVGDTVQAFAEVAITDATALAGLYLLLEHYPGSGGTTNSLASLRVVSGTGAGPVTGDLLTLATAPYTLTAAVGAGPYLALMLRAEAAAAGPAGFAVNRATLARVP